MARPKLVFDFNWKLSLFVLFMLPLLLTLGRWQLQRADEKRVLEQHWAEAQAQPAVALSNRALAADASNLRRVYASGHFVSEKFWLQENQVVGGQIGYQVIMPFALADGTLVAVDRGWLPGSPLRDFVPEVATPTGELTVSGTLVVPSDSKLVREAEVRVKGWPHKILEVDLPVLSSQIQRPLAPRLLRLDADSAAAFAVHWRPTNMAPAKHIGYAVQWFALALALVLLYLFASSNLGHVLTRRAPKP